MSGCRPPPPCKAAELLPLVPWVDNSLSNSPKWATAPATYVPSVAPATRCEEGQTTTRRAIADLLAFAQGVFLESRDGALFKEGRTLFRAQVCQSVLYNR